MSTGSDEHLTEKAAAHKANSSSEDLPYSPKEVEYNDDGFDEYDEEHGHAAEKRVRFYKTKRFWIRCLVILVILLAILVPLIIFVILPKLVQSIVNHSEMSMNQLNMTDASETGMKVSLTGGISNAGIFPATIEFPEPIVVSWEGHQLGSMKMSAVKASGGSATIVDSTTFTIIDKEAFGTFAKQMVRLPAFCCLVYVHVFVTCLCSMSNVQC
jgi:hypothetical protein